MDLNIYVPQGFNIVPNSHFECFENNPTLNKAFSCLNNKLISKTGECVMFIPLHRIFNSEDSIFLNKISPRDRSFNPNQVHANNLRNQIITLTEVKENWDSYLYHIGSNEAKEGFNADSVMYFHMELSGNLTYANKFDNLISLMIQKKDRGFVNIIVLFTKESGINPRKLLDSLKSNIYYSKE